MYLLSWVRSTPDHQKPCLRRDPAIPRGARSAADFAQFSLHVAGHLAVADRFALVVHVLASGQGKLELGPRALGVEVDAGRDEGETTLAGLGRQPLDLGAVQEQLARPFRVVVVA